MRWGRRSGLLDDDGPPQSVELIAQHIFMMSKWSMAMKHLLVKEAKTGATIIGQPPSMLLMTVLTVEYPSLSPEVGLLSVPLTTLSD
jgi:hypothetical protein